MTINRVGRLRSHADSGCIKYAAEYISGIDRINGSANPPTWHDVDANVMLEAELCEAEAWNGFRGHKKVVGLDATGTVVLTARRHDRHLIGQQI